MNKNNELFQPIEFWSDTIKILDGRVKQISTVYGFGEVSLKLVIRHGKILDVIYSEEVAVRQPETQKDDK